MTPHNVRVTAEIEGVGLWHATYTVAAGQPISGARDSARGWIATPSASA